MRLCCLKVMTHRAVKLQGSLPAFRPFLLMPVLAHMEFEQTKERGGLACLAVQIWDVNVSDYLSYLAT